jgi:hypothetical protein
MPQKLEMLPGETAILCERLSEVSYIIILRSYSTRANHHPELTSSSEESTRSLTLHLCRF